MPFQTENIVKTYLDDIEAILKSTGFADDAVIAVAEDAGAASGGAAGVEVSAEAATSALAALGGWVVVILLLGLVIELAALRFCERAIIHAIPPVPVLGGRAKAWVTWLFSHLDGLENSVLNALVHFTKHLWWNWTNAFRAMLLMLLPTIPMPTSGEHTTDLTRVYHILDRQAAEIGVLQHEISQLQQIVHGATVTVPDYSGPLTNAVRVLEHDVQVLHSNQIQFYHELQGVVVALGSVEHAISTLTHDLGGLHEIQVSFGDVVADVQRLEQTMANELSQTRSEVHTNTERLKRLAPLTLLLQPGMRGLRNLRKLEDNPCQCPHIPGIPNELGALLAVLDWAQHG